MIELAKTKVDSSYSVTFLNRTPIFEWCVIVCSSKKGYQNDMCLKDIQLHAQNMIIVPQ